MAIAKMNKIKLISLQEKKNDILQLLQGLGSVELVDMSQAYESSSLAAPSQKEEIVKEIKILERKYNEYCSHLSFLQIHLPKQPFLKVLKEKKAERTIEELELEGKKINQEILMTTIQEAIRNLSDYESSMNDLREQENFLIKWEKLTVIPNQESDYRYIQKRVGTIPQTASDDFIRSLRESDLIVIEDIFQTRDEYGIAVVFDKYNEKEVERLLDANHFFKLDYPYQLTPKEQLVKNQKDYTQLLERQKSTREQLSHLTDEEWQLKVLIELSYAELQRLKGQLFLIDETHLFVLEGWLETKKVSVVQSLLQDNLSESDYAFVVQDVETDDIESVPIVLENNKYVAPFEILTEMYSLPKYNEIDPTPFLMPFYLIFFGMMMADAGYGLMMFLVTTITLKGFPLSKSLKRSMTFFQLLGLATIVWGIIYGSFFGLELPIMLLSTMDDVNTILLISVVFGVIQIIFGLGLKTYMMLRDKNIYGALGDGVGWLTIIAGFILLIVSKLIFPNQLLSTIGIGIAIAGATLIIIATVMATSNKVLGVGIGLYNLYGISGYVGDIVSYTRLMALGVSGGSIGLAFNMIIDFLPPTAKFTVGILLFIVLHLVNIGLSALSAYVHGARLIFVEFFGKFYEGGGKALNPLKTSEEHIDLKNIFIYKSEE